MAERLATAVAKATCVVVERTDGGPASNEDDDANRDDDQVAAVVRTLGQTDGVSCGSPFKPEDRKSCRSGHSSLRLKVHSPAVNVQSLLKSICEDGNLEVRILEPPPLGDNNAGVDTKVDTSARNSFACSAKTLPDGWSQCSMTSNNSRTSSNSSLLAFGRVLMRPQSLKNGNPIRAAEEPKKSSSLDNLYLINLAKAPFDLCRQLSLKDGWVRNQPGRVTCRDSRPDNDDDDAMCRRPKVGSKLRGQPKLTSIDEAAGAPGLDPIFTIETDGMRLPHEAALSSLPLASSGTTVSQEAPAWTAGNEGPSGDDVIMKAALLPVSGQLGCQCDRIPLSPSKSPEAPNRDPQVSNVGKDEPGSSYLDEDALGGWRSLLPLYYYGKARNWKKCKRSSGGDSLNFKTNFFRDGQDLGLTNCPTLNPIGKHIVDCCRCGGGQPPYKSPKDDLQASNAREDEAGSSYLDKDVFGGWMSLLPLSCHGKSENGMKFKGPAKCWTSFYMDSQDPGLTKRPIGKHVVDLDGLVETAI